jgi:FkbM family methyltransferase
MGQRETPAQESGRDFKLVYDIGVNDGVDSAYYLTLSDRVIGVEASPVSCERLRARFAGEIADGRYVLLNVGIAEQEGELPFYMCGSNPDWSSFDRALAERGSDVRSVTVPTLTSSTLFARHGQPGFVKIDIEGYDKVFLASLSSDEAPPYISVELGHPDGGELIEQLTRLGYSRFKIVSQQTYTAPLRPLIWGQYALGNRARWWIRHLDKKHRGVARDGDWVFAFGSSGAFGEAAAGRWVSANSAYRTWRFLKDIDDRRDAGRGIIDWFDIHATR